MSAGLKKEVLSKSSKCPCGSKKKYAKCCGQFIKDDNVPLTAEELMRSRFTAYAIKNEAYLLATWHESTRPSKLDLENDLTQWVKLDILKMVAGKQSDDKGMVEFSAYFKVGDKSQALHEKSNFLKENGRWYYIDGNLNET